MKASMKSSLLGLGISVTVVPAVAMFAFIALMGSDIVKTANSEFRAAALEAARQATVDIRQMCDVIEISDDVATEAAKSIISEEIGKLGKISVASKPTSFSVFPLKSPEAKQIVAARLIRMGNDEISPDDFDGKLPKLLESLKARLFCDISVYSPIPESDFFVNVASTLTYPTGESYAGGTVSPKDGGGLGALFAKTLETKSPAGGLVKINSEHYSANCIPLERDDGQIGAIAVFGSPMPAVAELEKYLQNSNVGETGSVWVIDISDPLSPALTVSRDNSATGKIEDDPIEARRAFLRQIIEKSKNLRDGEIGVETVNIPSKDRRRDIVRLVTYTNYKPWKRIIGTSLDADEFSGSETALLSQIDSFSKTIVYVGAVFTVLAIGISWILASQMSRPLKILRRVAQHHSRGNMAAAESELAAYRDRGGARIAEFDSLILAIYDMTIGLSDLIKSIRDDGEYVADGAVQISELARSLESISHSEVASMRRVAATGKSISFSADAINRAARSSAARVRKTLDSSREGGDNLLLLKRNYDALFAATENVAERLSVINGNAEKITAVVTAIGEINKRTNLLSLNASIEAEKAGEVGLGFAVVARQIRRLADKTSKAASDIENAVRQMQSAVNSGVMEMDRFGASMRQSLKIILETADSLSRVVGDIEGVGPKFENIAGRIAGMSDSARRISETMTELSANSERMRDTVFEFKSATSSLDATSDSLLDEVSRFKTAREGGIARK